MSTLKNVQAEVGAWQVKFTPNIDRKALKLGEESGEVQGAIVKMFEGRMTLADVRDEIGDVLIVVLGLCDLLALDAERCLLERWTEVQER